CGCPGCLLSPDSGCPRRSRPAYRQPGRALARRSQSPAHCRAGPLAFELHCFLDPGERNQGWVEGGMFAMTFVLALHARGLASCCLNWAKDPESDQRMHALSGIPRSERIIMLLAIDHWLPLSP